MTGKGRVPVQRLLRRRPLQALRRLSEGATTAEIAAELGLARSTVDVYLSLATRALGAQNALAAAAAARRRGLFEPGGEAIALLTKRQREALVGAANGATNAKIGRAMGITDDAVNSLLKAAYRTLGARDRAQAVAVAMRLGIITGEDVALPATLAGPEATREAA